MVSPKVHVFEEVSEPLIVAVFDAARASHSATWCQNHLIGMARRKLQAGAPIHHDGVANLATARETARHDAAKLLATYCRACKGCPLSNV